MIYTPFEIKESGFKHLDRVIDLCSKNGLYTIVDLHAAPGYQNQDWHSDNPTHRSFFWQHKHFQDRVVHLWEVFADRYRDNPWIAGFNPINEPADPTGKVIGEFYRRIHAAIRAVDPNHILFLEGNRYGTKFDDLGEPLPNVVYALHDYALPGFIDGGPYPGFSRGQYVDREYLRRSFQQTCRFMLEKDLPIWVGEFGPVYTGHPEKDAARYQLLRDQLEIYREFHANWTLWTYKDLGLQGVVHLPNNSAWIQKISPVLAKKDFLGIDSWGGLDSQIREIMEPLERIFQEIYPNYDPFPFGAQWQINRIVRHILLAEPLQDELGLLMRGLSEGEIDRLMQSFLFSNCVFREELCHILAETQPSPAKTGGA
jgi:endoglucanase